MSRTPDNEDHELRERLRGLRVEPPDDGFRAAMRCRLVEAGPPPRVGLLQRMRSAMVFQSRLFWPATGLAMGVAVFLLASNWRGAFIETGRTVSASTVVPSSRVAIIRLDLSSDTAIAIADIEVRLPEGLAFWSDGSELPQRAFQWSQPLSAGQNEIPIAVRGQRPGIYRVKVRARIGEERVEHEIPLEVVGG